MLSKLEAFLKGKKTIIVCVLVGIGSVLQFKGIVIPDFVWTLLAGAGLGAVRSAIGNK